MKHKIVCKVCKTIITVFDSQMSLSHTGKYRVKCFTCRCINEYYYNEMEHIELTLNDMVYIVKCLKEGKDHPHLIGHVNLKIGKTKRCDRCGKITDVVTYNGIFNYDSDCSTECECSKIDNDDVIESCKDKDCKFHNTVPIEQLKKEHFDSKARQIEINNILNYFPPRGDGILELDKIAYVFYNTTKLPVTINDARAFVFDDFMLYCARNDLISPKGIYY